MTSISWHGATMCYTTAGTEAAAVMNHWDAYIVGSTPPDAGNPLAQIRQSKILMDFSHSLVALLGRSSSLQTFQILSIAIGSFDKSTGTGDQTFRNAVAHAPCSVRCSCRRGLSPNSHPAFKPCSKPRSSSLPPGQVHLQEPLELKEVLVQKRQVWPWNFDDSLPNFAAHNDATNGIDIMCI